MSFSQQLEKMVLENWEDGVWVNRMQELPFYDDEGRLIRKEIAHWNSTEAVWEDQTRMEYSRDEDGVLLSRETFKWDIQLSDWQPSLKASYTIDDQNKPSFVLTEKFDGEEWSNQSLADYEYNAKGQLVKKQLSRWDESTLTWNAYRAYEYQFEDTKRVGYTIYFKDNQTNEWQFYKRASYHYNNETVEYIVFETWLDGQWENHSVRMNFRDEFGSLNAMEVEVFDPISGDLKNSSSVSYELTDFGKISSSTSKKWVSEKWENLQRSTYHYSGDGTMMYEGFETNREMELFPNPAGEKLTIRSLSDGQLTVIDALGKVILQYMNSEEVVHLDISSWEMGMYSVQVDGKEVQKFVKQ
jgi:hypothetical protein